MPFKSISGSRIIGQGQPQAVPIQLDPAPYKGAIAYGSDGLIYVSNGTAWNAVGSGIQGTTGIQGDDGIQGLQGTYGPGFDVIGSVPDVDTGGDPQATICGLPHHVLTVKPSEQTTHFSAVQSSNSPALM